MNPRTDHLQANTRRHFLKSSSLGLGGMALPSLLGPAADAPRPPAAPLAPRPPHSPGKAKRATSLHMSGAPPHLDLLDYKPELVKHDGEACPDQFLKGKRFAFTSGVPKLLGTKRKYTQCGKAGTWMSDAIPQLHDIADDVTVIRSMK